MSYIRESIDRAIAWRNERVEARLERKAEAAAAHGSSAARCRCTSRAATGHMGRAVRLEHRAEVAHYRAEVARTHADQLCAIRALEHLHSWNQPHTHHHPHHQTRFGVHASGPLAPPRYQ